MENINYIDIEIDTSFGDKSKEIASYIKNINKCFIKGNNNFVDLCYYVYNLKTLFDGYFYLPCRDKKGKNYSFRDIMDSFNLNDTDISRLCSCYNKFILVDAENKNPTLIEEFKFFSKSKLIELITIPIEQLLQDIKTKVLRPDMSVKTIRDYVKNYKELQRQNKKLFEEKEEKQEEEMNEEDIPMAYNPKLHYDFSYFEDKTKAQLLNIIWQLQTEYERLKKEKKK